MTPYQRMCEQVGLDYSTVNSNGVKVQIYELNGGRLLVKFKNNIGRADDQNGKRLRQYLDENNVSWETTEEEREEGTRRMLVMQVDDFKRLFPYLNYETDEEVVP